MASKRQLFPHISIDCVLFGFDFEALHLLLIEREHGSPDLSADECTYALPGDLIYSDEDLDSGARRVLQELTGLDNIFLQQFGAFGSPDRLDRAEDQAWLRNLRAQPDERVVTIGYFSLVKMTDHKPVASSFARATQWVKVHDVGQLAFDHNLLLQRALKSLRRDIQTRPIGFNLLPPKFTLGQLQKLYEAIHDRDLDKRNFRRKILKLGIVKELEEKQTGVAHKPARFFSFDEAKYAELLEKGFENFRL